jgi:putative endopeptidase
MSRPRSYVAGPARVADSSAHGIDAADLDTTCSACVDFYDFATGGWRTRHPIPANAATWGTHDVVEARKQSILHTILADAVRQAGTVDSSRPPRSRSSPSSWQKVGLFYATCMDSVRSEQAGLSPLGAALDRIASIGDLDGVRREAARLQSTYFSEVSTEIGVPAIFVIRSRIDPMNSSVAMLVVEQGRFGLLARETYLAQDSASVDLRQQYSSHIDRLLILAGDDSATAARGSRNTLAIETALARLSRPRARRRDPRSVYHMMTLAEASALTPHISWSEWLADAGVARPDRINVADPDFFRGLDTLLISTPIEAWKDYLRARLLVESAQWLDSRFAAEAFRMQRSLTGVMESSPRWERCAKATDDALGDALGRAYVAKAFPPDTKARAIAMTRNLKAAFRQELSTLPWMAPSTRRRAIAKLDRLLTLVGYPDRWRDYSALQVERRPFVANLFAADSFEFRRQLAKVGRPVDRTEWAMTPLTVNAYAQPSLNVIVFPAAILQPPFFDPLADDPTNYGAAGALIGHEMTHGFDDRGRRYDSYGNLTNWWTAADSLHFNEGARRIVDEFNQYVAVDSTYVNGALTVGENIADLGGVRIAYAALERALRGKRRRIIAGFSPEQRFFLSYARFWAENVRPEAARGAVLVDQHAPARWRVNGPLSNMSEFARAFHCDAAQSMVRPPAQRVLIW